jgi:hypothetical protein
MSTRLERTLQWLLIRPGEGRLVAYLSLLFMIVGLGMALGRSSSDALLFKRVGVEVLPLMLFFTSLALALTSVVYAEFADRVAPSRMFRVIAVALSLILVVTWLEMRKDGSRAAFAAYFVAYGVASEILLVHLNFYASGFLNATQSKRLSPLVSAASRCGGMIGGASLGLLSSHLPIEHAALAWVAVLALTWGVLGVFHRGESARRRSPSVHKHRRFLGGVREGLQFARTSALLKITGVGLLVMIILISMQDYLVSTILTRHFHDERELAGFFGWFFAFSNLLVLLLQLAATNQLLRRFGLKMVSMIFPWSTAFTFGLLALSASFVPAVLARLNYMGMMPAFRNPAANLFYTALPAYMQGRARALNLVLVLPLGLGVAGLLLMWIPRSAVGETLALAGLALSLVYVALKSRKNRIYTRALADLIRQQVFVSNMAENLGGARLDPAVVAEIDAAMARRPEEEAFLTLANMLLRQAPADAPRIVLRYLPEQPPRVQDQLLSRVAVLDPAQARSYLIACLEAPDLHLRVTALRALAAQDAQAAEEGAVRWLGETHPRLRAQGIRIALGSASAPVARQALQAMLQSPERGEIIAALKVVGELGLSEHAASVQGYLVHPEPTVRAAAVGAAGGLLERGLLEFAGCIQAATADAVAEVRRAALGAARYLADAGARMQVLAKALDDEAMSVRQAAREAAPLLMPRTLEEYAVLAREHQGHFRLDGMLAQCLARSGLDGRRKVLTEMCSAALGRATEMKSMVAELETHQSADTLEGANARFLRIVLEEEIARTIDLALESLSHLDVEGAARAARAALASRDSRCRAQAVESVRNIDDPEIVHLLLPLLEAQYDGAKWARSSARAMTSLAGIVDWCEAQGSPWLRQVATTLKGELNLERAV